MPVFANLEDERLPACEKREDGHHNAREQEHYCELALLCRHLSGSALSLIASWSLLYLFLGLGSR